MTTPLNRPTGRRAATIWVGATGAVLLVAAAAVFVAVRWDTLPESAKLALVGGLTGAFLVAGRRLQTTLPATGDVAIAGLAPPLGAAATSILDGTGTRTGSGTLVELGFGGRSQQLLAVLSGILAAAALARQAHARRDLRLAFFALASVAVGLARS